MERQLKERLTGAVVLVAAAVIVIPMVLSGPPELREESLAGADSPPPAPGTGERARSSFSSRIVPLGAEQAAPPPQAREAPPPAAAPLPGAPLPDAAPARKSRPAPAPRRAQVAGPGSREGWVVQLGSFSNSRNAAALRDKLRAKGYSAFVESSGSGTAAVTRVFVGPEAKRESAERAVGRLFEETRLKGIVVRYPGT